MILSLTNPRNLGRQGVRESTYLMRIGSSQIARKIGSTGTRRRTTPLTTLLQENASGGVGSWARPRRAGFLLVTAAALGWLALRHRILLLAVHHYRVSERRQPHYDDEGVDDEHDTTLDTYGTEDRPHVRE